jgi:hypothetical protein
MHSVKGSFHLKAGEVMVDSKTGAVQGKIEVDLTSGTSGNDGRDDRMKREILETTSFHWQRLSLKRQLASMRRQRARLYPLKAPSRCMVRRIL